MTIKIEFTQRQYESIRDSILLNPNDDRNTLGMLTGLGLLTLEKLQNAVKEDKDNLIQIDLLAKGDLLSKGGDE